MTRTRTIGSLTGSIRIRGEFEDHSGQGYDDANISTAILLDFIDSAHAESWDILIDADPDRYLETYTATVNSTGSISTPDDLYRLRAVDVQSGDSWYKLERYELGDRELFENGVYSNVPTKYRLFGNSVRIQPIVQNASVRLTYNPLPTRITSSVQTVDDVNGLPELTVLLALRRCLVRQDESTSAVDGDINKQTQRLKNAASSRDRGSPRFLQDPRTISRSIRRR